VSLVDKLTLSSFVLIRAPFVSLVDKPGYPEFPMIVSNPGHQKFLFCLAITNKFSRPVNAGLFFINANDILILLLSKNNNTFLYYHNNFGKR